MSALSLEKLTDASLPSWRNPSTLRPIFAYFFPRRVDGSRQEDKLASVIIQSEKNPGRLTLVNLVVKKKKSPSTSTGCGIFPPLKLIKP